MSQSPYLHLANKIKKIYTKSCTCILLTLMFLYALKMVTEVHNLDINYLNVAFIMWVGGLERGAVITTALNGEPLLEGGC